jgi:hypothetical protein
MWRRNYDDGARNHVKEERPVSKLPVRGVGRREETERFEDRKMGRPSPKIIFLSLIFLSIECGWKKKSCEVKDWG